MITGVVFYMATRTIRCYVLLTRRCCTTSGVAPATGELCATTHTSLTLSRATSLFPKETIIASRSLTTSATNVASNLLDRRVTDRTSSIIQGVLQLLGSHRQPLSSQTLVSANHAIIKCLPAWIIRTICRLVGFMSCLVFNRGLVAHGRHLHHLRHLHLSSVLFIHSCHFYSAV